MSRGLEPAGEPFATIEIACQRYSFDLIKIRWRNLVAPEVMAYRNPLSFGYTAARRARRKSLLCRVFAWSLPRFFWEIM